MRRTGRGGKLARSDHHEIAHRGGESVRRDRVFAIGADGKGSLLRGPIDFEFGANSQRRQVIPISRPRPTASPTAASGRC
jgi:hypothetical protein